MSMYGLSGQVIAQSRRSPVLVGWVLDVRVGLHAAELNDPSWYSDRFGRGLLGAIVCLFVAGQA